MGNEPSHKPTMMPVSRRVVDTLAAMLDPNEREAVLGDLAESGESGGEALREVLGLLIRRQVAVWTAWRPWLTLTLIIIPLGIFLSVLSRFNADESAVYLWLYANNWDWGLITNRGFWYVFSESAMLVLAGWLTLVCWSWTAGFLLGYFSKGIVRLNGVLLLVALVLGEAVVAPAYATYSLNYLHSHFHLPSMPDPNAPVFALPFYSAIFPVIMQVMLVAGPALYGMRAGVGMTRLRDAARAFFLTAAFLTIGTMVIRMPGFLFLLHADSHEWMLKFPRAMSAVQFVTYWPALYLLAIVVRDHRRESVSSLQLS
jgi:hypothetical protein